MSATAVEAGLLAKLAADAGVRALLGDPPRVFDAATARPSYPYLEIIRHEMEPNGGAEAEADSHRIDLAIVSRDTGRMAMKEALAAVKAALSNGDAPAMSGLRCVLMLATFADMVRGRFGIWRGMVRVKAVVEPA